jgi:hypothetical protein
MSGARRTGFPTAARAAHALVGALLVLAALAAPARAQELTEAQVRGFVARQERAWNAGDLAAWSDGFARDARFTDQYRTPSGQVVPYGTSTLAAARAQSAKFRATATLSETGQVLRVALAPDRRGAEVTSRVVSRIQRASGLRVTCAERRQELVLAAGRLRSKGQTDTFSRCPR